MLTETILLNNLDKILVVGDRFLTIEEVVSVARHSVQVCITNDPDILGGVQASSLYMGRCNSTRVAEEQN
ncbi:hypothetical protein A6770_30360 [Nostoc minutum NIES-26]|uniref:Uncharacterized protein n=1 Tax=Nostoc minutum NIES-26 TaxID=1844469 RepID=A0A367QB86_9NOSO|nr:hypothetical protein A6770_30360 [Nostoc minutum NIES-26]